MNYLELIEGKSGEAFSVEMLRILMLRSNPCREAVMNAMREVLSYHIMSFGHFSCYTEHTICTEKANYTEHMTSDEQARSGRIDLVIEVDNAVIGVEAKFWAGFQSDQPVKYVPKVERIARKLSSVRNHKRSPHLLVLAPECRRNEINQKIPADSFIGMLSWELVIKELKKAEEHDPAVIVMRNEFVEYLRVKLAFLKDYPQLQGLLNKKWDDRGRGTAEQHNFLRGLRAILPNPSGRIGGGPGWCGYYFTPADEQNEDGPRGWVGFVPMSRATRPASGQSAAILVIAPPTPPETMPEGCAEIDLQPKITVDGAKKQAYEIKFDQTWGTQEKWRSVIDAFVKSV